MADNRSGENQIQESALESTLDSVDAAEELVLEKARQMGFDEDGLHKLGMAVREAMVNAVVHGNRYNLKKHVHLRLEESGNQLTIVIKDEGEGFAPEELPDPLAEENLLRQSGRGLLLIQAFVDQFSMKRAEKPFGTEVRMTIVRSDAVLS